MAEVLDYSSRVPRRPLTWVDKAYLVLTCICYACATVGEAIMPTSPHRADPMVAWAVFCANVADATAGVLFLWGLLYILRRNASPLTGILWAAWVANGILPIVSFLFTHSGGPFLYR